MGGRGEEGRGGGGGILRDEGGPASPVHLFFSSNTVHNPIKNLVYLFKIYKLNTKIAQNKYKLLLTIIYFKYSFHTNCIWRVCTF